MKKVLSIILTVVMLCSIFALPAMAETETDNRVWFDLNGNSKVLMLKNGTEYATAKSAAGAYKDFLPGVDYGGVVLAPIGDFETDVAAISSKGDNMYAFVYTVDNGTKASQWNDPDFTTGEDGYIYWTVNEVAYRVNPSENIIKVCKIPDLDTSGISNSTTLTDEKKAEIIARYNSVNEGVTMDVEDGKYSSVGILAGIGLAERDVKVTLTYSDGKTKSQSFTLAKSSASSTTSFATGTFYFKKFYDASFSQSSGSRTFVPCEITADVTKTLASVTVTATGSNSYTFPIYVVSAWGVKAGNNDYISAIEEMMADGIGDVDEYNSVKEYMNLIKAEELNEEQKVVYDNTLSALAAFEANLEEMEKEAARQEAMTKRTYNYLTLSADRDVFVTWKDVTDLARFQYDAEGTTSKAPEGFNTATYAYSETETIPDWIPYVRADGTKVTGKEYYYYKGFQNVPLTELSENEAERGAAPASATFAYLLDDITAEDGAIVTGKKVAGISSSSKYGSDEYYAGSNGVARATTDTTRTITNPAFVQKLDEDGYAIIKKNKESKTYFKIGPVVQEGYSPNAQLIGSSINNVNVKGTTLDLLITATNINYSTTYYKTASAAVNFAPAAALQQVTVTYEDGETETKYAVVTDNKIASWNGMYTENPVLKTIVFAPKYEEDGITEIEYDENSFYANKADYDFKILKGNTATVGLTDSVSADDVSFKNPHIIMSSNTRVAQVIQIRQDAMHNNYGAFSSSVSLPLANKKVESIAFPVTQNIAIDDPSAIVVLDNAKDASKSTVALLPVTIKGANDDYVYFAYLGRISSETYLMAATVTENSSKEKIEAAEAVMSKITVNSPIEEAKKAAELYNIALEDVNVKESDFDSVLVTAFNNAYMTIRESVEISGKIAVKYFKGEKPSAEVEIYNPAELAGKTYKVILAYYDEKGNYISSKIHDGKSTTAEKVSFTIVDEECPENVAKVKGFIWKGFDTLLPLATADETTKKDTFKVLSIGNSYSNNAHSHLVKIAADAGFEKVEIANIYKGGCTLKEHYNNAVANTPAYTYEYQELAEDGTVKKTTVGSSEADGEKVTMLYGIQANDWDVITIQQQSLNSGVESSYVKEQIDYLVEYINKNKTNKNAKLVWHMTWPYATYYTGNTLYGTYFDYNQNSMYKGIVEAVQTHIATRDDFDYIIPAGTAIQNARLLGLDEKELSNDGTHLNSLGCYVAGLTWFAKITGMSIDNITYAPTTVPEGSLDSIKTAVKNAINNPYQVTE